MDARILMPCKSDVANLARFLGIEERFVGSAFTKNAIGIIETYDFVVLHQINVIGLKTFQGSFDLTFSN